MQHYEANDQKLKKFVPIIKGSLVYPVVLDAKRTVLSLPPIINGAHSAVRPRPLLRCLSCAPLLCMEKEGLPLHNVMEASTVLIR